MLITYGIELVIVNKHSPIFTKHMFLLVSILRVSRPRMVTYFKWTPIFDWYVVRHGSKNGHQKYTCLKDSGLHAQFF